MQWRFLGDSWSLHCDKERLVFFTERLKIAICMKEGEYLKRLSGCLMNHYQGNMEIHIFTDVEQMAVLNGAEYHGFLIGDYNPHSSELKSIPREKMLYLKEFEEEVKENGQFYEVSKYEEVPRIVDMLEMLGGNKERVLAQNEENTRKMKQIGVYTLNEAHMQFPFFMTLANILAEKKRVLVMDLQENSGLGAEEVHASGMEDVMAMAKTQKYTRGRLIAAMGHFLQWDYIYPVRNSECLCEGDYHLYKSILQIMEKEMNYDVVIINFGVRFQGFFQLLSDCNECFFLGEQSKKNWREKAFYEEVEKRGSIDLVDKFLRIHMPENRNTEVFPQKLAEQWIWSELGDYLRKLVYRENGCG